MHSALHVGGRRLYEYARAGEEVERLPRQIEIFEVTRTSHDGNDLTLAVTCSKGTYIRTLAQDIGRALGCGAHLVGLRRTAVGPFSLRDAVSFEQLEAEGSKEACLLAPEALVSSLPRFEATPEEADRFGHGRTIDRVGGRVRDEVAVYAPGGRFLGVGLCEAPERIAPLRLMSSAVAKSPDFA